MLRLTGLLGCLLGRDVLSQTITFTPTFNNIGVVVDLPAATSQSVVHMYLKTNGAPATAYREIHPLSRLNSKRFAGSAFGLEPGTRYDFKLSSTAFSADLFGSAATRADTFPDATNATYHVSPTNGNDNNNGSSLTLAFRTLNKALSVASAGSKILLHDGNYFEGDLMAPRSGTASAPIVIQNAPGAKAVLNGLNKNFTANWTVYDSANHVYRTACASTPQNAYLNGGQFYHYQALTDLLSHPWNQPGGYYVDGTYLYARFPNDTSPGTNQVTIPAHTTGLTLAQKSYLQIRGLEFCYYGLDDYHRAIYIDGGDSNLVDQCFFHQNGVGVAFKRAADFNTIQHCVFTEYPIASWSWHAVKDGSTDYETGGILIYGSTETNRGNVIRFCAFTNMFDGSHLYSDDPTGPTENLDFHNNLIQGCVDDGIETDGAGSNCRIYFNRFQNTLTGISVAPCAIGPTYIFRNIISDWRPSEEFDGYPFKFNVSATLLTQWGHLYHNTCFSAVPAQDGFLFKDYSNWTNIISRNNVFVGTSYALESYENVASTVDFDYDAFYTTKAAPLITWAGTRYNSLSQFATAIGEETHGVWAQPGFLDSAAHDFYLTTNSALIDRGVVIPGINDDYLGTAPDIGALESGMQVKRISIGATGVSLEWQVGPLGNYQLQYATNLQGAWQDLGGPALAEHSRLQLSDPQPVDPRRFYRLRHAIP